MREEILALLEEEFPQIDFTSSNTMVDDGIMDSMTITGIIALFAMEYGIHVPYEEIIEENFNSLDGLVSMAERLRK